MSQPNTTGQLGLDIAEFEAAWERAMVRLDAAGNRINNVNAGLNRSSSAFAQIGRVLAGGAILSFVHTLTTAGREANTLTKELDDLDISTHADKFGEAEIKARGFKDSLLDITAALSRIPLIGPVIDIAMAPLKNAVEVLKSVRQFKQVANTDAGDSSAMMQKFQEFERMRSDARKSIAELESPKSVKEAAIGGTEEARQKQIKTLAMEIEAIDENRNTLAYQLAHAMDREGRARNEILARSKEESQVEAARAEALERVAALRNSLVNKDTGDIREEDQSLFHSLRAKIKTEAAMQVEGIHAAAKATRDVESGEVKIAATKMFGARGEAAAADIRLSTAKEIYEIEKDMTAERRKAAGVSLVSASVESLMKKQALDDSTRLANLERIEAAASIRGFTQIANRARLMATFMPRLAQAAREFGSNSPQFAAVQAQFQGALIQQKVAEHDETPGERARAAHIARRNLSKAAQLDRRDAELQRRSERGTILAPRDAARLERLKEINRQGPNFNQDAADRAAVVKAVVDIASIMRGGK